MAPSLHQIKPFITTAEVGILLLAASQLGFSYAAVAETIKALEHKSGVEPLRRRAKGIEVTCKGNQFLRYAHTVVAADSGWHRITSC